MTPDQQAQAATTWWRSLQPAENGHGGDRAALAVLRRAELTTAMEHPATFDLFRRLAKTRPGDLPDIALCAGVLATIHDDTREHPMRALGLTPGDAEARPRLSRLRLARLIAADTAEDLLTALRRAVALADHAVSVREIAAACLDWSEERRRRWIFEYHGAGRAAPNADTESQAEETVR